VAKAPEAAHSWTRALSGGPSEAIDMLGLLRVFLTLLIAAVALHVMGLAWQQYYRSVYFADARGLDATPERLSAELLPPQSGNARLGAAKRVLKI